MQSRSKSDKDPGFAASRKELQAGADSLAIHILPLVPNITLPIPSPAVARSEIPPGYGVQEQCMPFTSATGLGFLIPSPITFGFCPPAEVPVGVHVFSSPLDSGTSSAQEDKRAFYVKDDPACCFVKNAFTMDPIEVGEAGRRFSFTPVQPGLSFFDREDQRDLFKLHLPYIWRTPPAVDTLFLPCINRSTPGITVLTGLVETDWYANPVNMVLRKPRARRSIHIEAGGVVAQGIFVARSQRCPSLKILAPHARLARDLRAELIEWYKLHARDRSAYKKSVRRKDDDMLRDL